MKKLGNHFIEPMTVNEYVQKCINPLLVAQFIVPISDGEVTSTEDLYDLLDDLSNTGMESFWDYPLAEMLDDTVIDYGYVYAEIEVDGENRYFETCIPVK